MKKVTNFSIYKKVLKMTYNDFNRWVTAVYVAAYEDGIQFAEKKVNEVCAAEMTDERMLEIFKSVKGIGPVKAQALLDAVLNEGTAKEDEKAVCESR